VRNKPVFHSSVLVPFCHTLDTVHSDSVVVAEFVQLRHVNALQSRYQQINNNCYNPEFWTAI